VKISGRELADATSVSFGTVRAVRFTINSAGTSIIAYSPAGSPGTVNVTVTTPLGTSTITTADRFTFN
jgi:hypothetical protein